MANPEAKWQELAKQDKVDPVEAAAVFASLKPVAADFMTQGKGEWQGFNMNTGHPTREKMIELRWAGKTFRNVDDVDPIVVYDAEQKREWNEDWGHAQLREVVYQGTPTIAMFYDDFPIIDYFHYVTDDIVAGAMDSKKMKSFGTYYFWLKRI